MRGVFRHAAATFRSVYFSLQAFKRPVRGISARDAAEHDAVCAGQSANAVRTVHSSGALSACEQSRNAGPGILVD